MDVKIERGVEWRDDLRNVAPNLWPDLIAEYRFFCQRALPTDCRSLLRMVSEGEHVGWAGYNDRATYLREGLGLDPQAAEWAIAGLSIAGVEVPIEYANAQTLGKHGGARPIRNEIEQGAIGTLKRGTNSAAYLIAKLKRDAPEYAERLAVGEFRSIRAAALAAGIIKPPPSWPERVLIAWRHCTPEERAMLHDKLK